MSSLCEYIRNSAVRSATINGGFQITTKSATALLTVLLDVRFVYVRVNSVIKVSGIGRKITALATRVICKLLIENACHTLAEGLKELNFNAFESLEIFIGIF